MRLDSRKIKYINTTAIILAILFALVLASCSGRKAKLDRRNMIPEKELVKLLTDLCITDGLLTHPHVNKWFPVVDTMSTYYHIIEKHGYTKENLDKTLKFYFYRNPKKLIDIYDRILGILSEMDSQAEKAVLSEQILSENLWPGKYYYPFPDVQGDDQANFDILLNRLGTYTLTFTATLYPDDQSENPALIAWTYLTDASGNEVRTYFKPVKYLKDGMPHDYSTTVTVTTVTNIHFAGNLFAIENNPGTGEKHCIIESVKIGYLYSIL
jgi:hypothetical protein